MALIIDPALDKAPEVLGDRDLLLLLSGVKEWP
jgi:hypothetical protein